MNNDNQKIFLIIIVVIAILVSISIFFTMNIGLISSGITSEVSSGTQYDKLATLKSNYGDLKAEFNVTKQDIFAGSDKAKENEYIAGELELIRADKAIGDVESAMKVGKPSEEVDAKIKIAQEKLNTATQAYNNL